MNLYEHLKTLSKATRKTYGVTYTPQAIAKQIVELALKEWVFDTPPRIHDYGCGTGIFLQCAVEAFRERWPSYDPLQYIAGCDIDEKAVQIACSYGLPAHHASMFEWATQADIVIGNPPYVRIQNLNSTTRRQVQAQPLTGGGDSDLYLASIELALKNANICCIICPNSWMTSKAATRLRKYIAENQLLKTVIDYEEQQIFDDVQTYVCIVLFTKADKTIIQRKEKTLELNWPRSESDLCFVPSQTGTPLLDICDIRVGLATLADRVFYVKDSLPNCKPCVKASKSLLERAWIIYPYDDDGKPLQEQDLHKDTLAYLMKHKEKLLSRSDTGPLWYTYGRTQGFSCFGPKILIPPAQKDVHGIKLSDECCYYISGYAAFPKKGYSLNDIDNVFSSSHFHDWVHERGKPMSGGFVGVNKTILKNYNIP